MCAFFARPNLDNTQFKQLQGGEPLTLSGQTQIATTSGLTLIGDGGMYIPVIATGASDNFVLTYDSGQQAIVLKQSTASGASTIYDYTDLTTCAVGGIGVGECLCDQELKTIIHSMVSPTVYPDLSNPSISAFSISPPTTLYEVGAVATISATAVFDAGDINPPYPPLTPTDTCRSNGTICYIYNALAYPYQCVVNAGSNTYAFDPTPIVPNSNVVSATICYQAGLQPYDSSGAIYCSSLPAGTTATSCKTITGVYPWYWGTVTCAAAAGVGRPDADCIKHEITGGTANKEVGLSNGTLNVTFGSTANDYIWFAIPSCGGVEKTCWFIDALNNQPITGGVSAGGCLFPAYNAATDLITGVNSAQSCWSGESYEVYVSNYQSSATVNMQLRNS